MAGRVYDRRPLQVDRNPIKQLAVEVGNLPKTDPGKFVAAAIQFVSDYLIDAIKTVTGVDLLNPSTWPIIGDLIEAFTGIEDGDVNDLGTYANNIKTALGGLNLADPDFDFVRWAQNFLQVIIAPLVKLLNPLLGNEENPNLLAAGAFQTAASLSPESTGWSHDSAVGRTALGSAKFTAAGGVTGALQSNPIAVAPGQFLDVSGWVRWEGLTATGQAIKLDVNAYASTGGLVTTVTLDAITNPAANQLAWIELDTVWTVPAGVATIRIRPAVENASAGLVWFDDLVVRKTTLLQQQAQQLEDDAQAGAQAFATLLSSWQTTLTTPAQSWPTLFAALNDAWQTYVTTNNAIIADQWATLADIIYGVLGFNPTSGQLPPSKVEGLGDSWTQLGAALSGDLAHSGTWAWLAQIMITWFGVSSTAHSMAVDSANTLGIRNNVPTYVGPDNTSESNLPITAVDFTTTIASNINSTGVSVIALVRCQHDDVKGAISFLAERPSAAGPVYVTAFKLDPVTRNLVRLWASADIRLLIPTTKNWARYVFPAGKEIPVDPGDVLAFEIHYANSLTTMNVYGQRATTGVPNHPSAILSNMGGYRTSPGISPPAGDILAANWTFTDAAPYVAVEIVGASTQTYPPVQSAFTAPGVRTYEISTWAKYVDLVGMGGAGGGQGNMGVTDGHGGTGGDWATQTLERGVDFPTTGPTVLTITVGAGGVGGAYFTDGANGQPTTISWVDPGGITRTLTAPGGFGGDSTARNLSGFGLGPSPTTKTFAGQSYTAGVTQISRAPGNVPGGAGAGGGTFQYGFDGARGQAWTVERQN